MITLLLAGLVLSPVPTQHRSQSHAVTGVFRDEMRSLVPWNIYNTDRSPSMTITSKGLKVTLGHVPDGWPYAYQWSGARRTIQLDVAHYPRLVADVPEVSSGSYAHFELSVLDANDREVKNLRSASVTEPGQIDFDLSKDLLPAIYKIDLRLIVGGSNNGASVTYRWVRAIGPAPVSSSR
jgi:hypothetical protein